MKLARGGRGRTSGIAGLCLLALGLAGCSTDGQAKPAPSVPPVSSAAASSSAQADPFAGMKACDVLNQVLQGTGMPPGEPERYGGDNGCQSNKPQEAAISLYLVPDRNYDDLNDSLETQHRGDVSGRPSIMIKGQQRGGCDISMQVAGGSRAIIGVMRSVGTTEQACQMVEELAAKIDPLLPEV